MSLVDSMPTRPYPKPTEEEPDIEELEDAMMDGSCSATDGCTVEPDGWCSHGHVSWLLYLGMI